MYIQRIIDIGVHHDPIPGGIFSNRYDIGDTIGVVPYKSISFEITSVPGGGNTAVAVDGHGLPVRGIMDIREDEGGRGDDGADPTNRNNDDGDDGRGTITNSTKWRQRRSEDEDS